MSDTSKQLKSLKLIGGVLCLDFANTDDLLNDYADLLTWAERAEAVVKSQADRLRQAADSAKDQARTAFDRALALRKAIRRTFSSQAQEDPLGAGDLALLSTVVGRSAKHLRLQPSPNGVTWEWHDVENQLDWPSWIVARSAADLLVSDRRDHVRECASNDCNWLFIDTSRNHSRRWCDMANCGNRAKARRSYARKREPVSRRHNSDAK
ncbi:CGNR zinc finger domain-containing protein [Candidatus Bipolaricaulota bacterium]